MRKILANNSILLCAAALLIATGLAMSFWFHSFSWLVRFGAMVTGVGILLLARPTIVGKDIMVPVIMEPGLTQLDRAYYERSGESVPEWVHEDRRSRYAVGVFGPVITLCGTLIMGFADLLNPFLGW